MIQTKGRGSVLNVPIQWITDDWGAMEASNLQRMWFYSRLIGLLSGGEIYPCPSAGGLIPLQGVLAVLSRPFEEEL